MTLLANSLKRIRSAQNRLSNSAGGGSFCSRWAPKHETLLRWMSEGILDLVGVLRRTSPVVTLVAYNFFR